MKAPELTNKVKFYADLPDGQRNKLCTYSVHNYAHAIDIIVKYKREGAAIRKAYYNTFYASNGMPLNVAITPKAYEDEFLHETYSERQRYEQMKRNKPI